MMKKKKLVVRKKENGNGNWKLEIGNYKFLLFLLLVFTLSISVFSLAIEPKTPSPPPLLTPEPGTLNPLFIPVLVYHHIGTPLPGMTGAEKSFFIEPEWFEKHLRYLQENNFQTVRFSDVAAYFEKGTVLPIRAHAHAVIISFDDGWKSALDAALPLLQKYNMTATVFIPTKLISEKPSKGMRMNWDDIAKLRDAGWEIGSHSLWHPYLTKSQKVKLEVEESKKILEEKLGISITTFAYPFGASSEHIEKTVKEAGYSTARSYTSGSGITRENLFHIPVVKVWTNTELQSIMRAQRTPLFPY